MSNENLSKPVQRELKKTTGIEIHKGKIRIVFQYEGKRCREIHPLEVNVPNIKHAANKRAVILLEIANGTFVYGEHFPNSKRALASDAASGKRRTVSQGIELWLAAREMDTAPSTFRNYKSKALIHVEQQYGIRAMDDITKSELEVWRSALLSGKAKTADTPMSSKTVNDIFTVVRGIFGDAFDDGLIQTNPVARMKNLKRSATQQSAANPFTMEELDRMAKTKTRRKSEKNMIMFDCWMGLSISELIAMAWEDVDFDNWTLHVRRARVDGEFKVPKEESRDRVIEIIEPAREWLLAQREISRLMPAITEPVRQRDNIEVREETFSPVWINTDLQRYHENDWAVSKRFLSTFLKKAKVDYRPANQCRHTFASRMLSAYMEPHWIAKHMGHNSTTMIQRHYAEFMPKEAPKMSDLIMQRLNGGSQ